MSAQQPPAPTKFVLNDGNPAPYGRLLIAPAGALNTIVITGNNFDANTKFIVSNNRATDTFSTMPATGTLSGDRKTLTGSFTIFGPTPLVAVVSTPPPVDVDSCSDEMAAGGGPVLIAVTVTTTGVVGGDVTCIGLQESIPT